MVENLEGDMFSRTRANVCVVGLRIHEDTERGDNETVKISRKKVQTGLGCCQGT